MVPIPQQHPPARPLTPASWFFIIIISAFLSALVIVLVTFAIAPNSVREAGRGLSSLPFVVGGPGEKVILVMGVDINYLNKDRYRFEGTRTDTMMLVRVSPDKRTISIVSIPRDSKVYLSENRGIDKINAAHALGGPDLAVETVQDSFGIPVDNYVVMNFAGVHELVDAIGGVEVFVDKPMRYHDQTAKLHINFQPGLQQLDGHDAEAFLRFRHDALADIGRIRRQQQFLASVAKKMRNPLILTKIPQLIDLANKYVETDLTPDEMFRLAAFAKDIELKDMRVATMPGHPSGGAVSYWIVDSEPAQEVLDRLVLDNPGAESLSSSQDPLRVGILYTAKAKQKLPKLVAALEAKQFQISCKSMLRNATTQIVEHTSRVSDRFTNRLRNAEPGLGNARLIFAPVGTTFENNACSSGEDYTLILGDDIRI